MKTESNPSSTRRHFLRQTAAAAAFTLVPRHVLGSGLTPPSEKLNIACVGVGGKGFSDAEAVSSHNIVALCDVDDQCAARAFNTFPNAKRYRDWRVMLDKEPQIDAVMVATPDHCHALISLAAMKLGKHVYCQKPLTHTVEEAQRMAAAAVEKKVATQMGNQGHASEATARIQELIAADAIGPVRQVHVWTDRPMNGMFGEYWPQGVSRPGDTPRVPGHLDWDVWLGPAPERPYHAAYHPFRWRGWWDFGTGALGDIGCHALDSVFRALKLDYPESVQAACSRVNNETYPVASVVTYTFPARDTMPPVTLTWYDGGLKPPRPEATTRRRRNPVHRRQGQDPRRPYLPRIQKTGLHPAAQNPAAFHRPLRRMAGRLQDRLTDRVEFCVCRPADRSGDAGQYRSARGFARTALAADTGVGCGGQAVFQPVPGKCVPEKALSPRLVDL